MPRWRIPLALLACSIALMLVAAGCGGDDDDGGTASPGGSNSGTDSTPNSGSNGSSQDTSSPELSGPASKYSLLNPEDFGSNPAYITEINRTFEFKQPLDYTRNNSAWSSAEAGEKQLKEWGYESGYQTWVSPENRERGILNGGHGVILELHLFNEESGAKEAYSFFKKFIGQNGQSPVGIEGVGNESTAWKYVSGTVGQSNMPMAYYTILFRRGNLVATVVGYGAETLMKAADARVHAGQIDEKALGKRAAITPTPTGNYNPDGYASTTPSPSATP